MCFVGTEIAPSKGSTFVGGHVNTVVRLCKGLSALGWEIHIVTTPYRFLRIPSLHFPWAKTHLLNASGRYGSPRYGVDFIMKALTIIESINQSEAFDVIHAHSGYFGTAVVPAIIGKKLGIPALFSLYCPASLLPNKLPMDKFGIRLLSAGLDKVVAVSNNVKRSLLKSGVNANKIEVIPPCIDEEFFNSFGPQKISKEVEIAGLDQMVLFVGNIDRTKGLDLFLEAARSVLDKGNLNVKFVIKLHEPYETVQKLKVVASSRLGSSVEVMGVVEDMANLMARADILVAPFRSTEGIADIPLVILEAMALGKTIVASNLEGIKEVINDGENGILVDLNHPDELANAVSNLLNDPNLRAEISNQAISCVKRFSHSEISRRLSDLYIKVIENA